VMSVAMFVSSFFSFPVKALRSCTTTSKPCFLAAAHSESFAGGFEP